MNPTSSHTSNTSDDWFREVADDGQWTAFVYSDAGVLSSGSRQSKDRIRAQRPTKQRQNHKSAASVTSEPDYEFEPEVGAEQVIITNARRTGKNFANLTELTEAFHRKLCHIGNDVRQARKDAKDLTALKLARKQCDQVYSLLKRHLERQTVPTLDVMHECQELYRRL